LFLQVQYIIIIMVSSQDKDYFIYFLFFLFSFCFIVLRRYDTIRRTLRHKFLRLTSLCILF
jgi:hypothetical protein